MKRILTALGAVAFILIGLHAQAQVKGRWHLKYEQGHPQIYTHRDKSTGIETYWYFTFKVTNPTDERVPILVDIQLYVETGKSHQTDKQKVHIPTIDNVFDKEHGAAEFRPHEQANFGRFYSNVIAPEAEYAIIEHHLRLGNRLPDRELRHHVNGLLGGNRTIVEESILAFKQKNYFLNPREMRIKGWLQPGESITGLAIYHDIDPRANVVETHVSGLWDIFKLEKVTDEDIHLTYENKVFVTTYRFRGDAYERVRDQLLPPPQKKWITKHIGPIASKETVTELVQSMVEYVKDEEDWRLQGLTPDEIQKARHDSGMTDADIHNMAKVVSMAIVIVDFGYDRDQSPYENRYAIWRMHEWWLTNKSRLQWDGILNRYKVVEEPLPGHDRERRDH